MDYFLLRTVFVITVLSGLSYCKPNDPQSCYIRQKELRDIFGPFVVQYYWYPKCASGDYWQSVQCDAAGCYCAYVDTGIRIPNSVSQRLFQYMESACPVESENTPDLCAAQPEHYPCKKKTTRYYYNTKTDSCEASEHGCLGFETPSQCKDACVELKKDRCNFNLHKGRKCLRRQPSIRWHHNDETGTCESFEYEGCGGNSNNYQKEWMCMKRCKSDVVTKVIVQVADKSFLVTIPKWLVMIENMSTTKPNYVSQRKFEVLLDYAQESTVISDQTPTATTTAATETNTTVHVEWPEFALRNMTRKQICDLPKDPGPCRGYEPRWYFNTTNSKCQRFVYGSCLGNGNNFETVMHCAKFCEAKVEPTEWEILQSKLGIFFEGEDPSTTEKPKEESRERDLDGGPPVPPSAEGSGNGGEEKSTTEKYETKVSESDFDLILPGFDE